MIQSLAYKPLNKDLITLTVQIITTVIHNNIFYYT